MEEEVVKEVKKTFSLPNTKVTIRLINRARGAINDPKHILYNMAPGATFELCPKNLKGTNIVDCPLTREEIEFFENKRLSGMSFNEGELSPHAPDKINFWKSKRAKVQLDNTERTFDLSKAMDYLQYKICLSNPKYVANGLDQEFSNGTTVYVLVYPEEEQSKAIKKGDKKKRAWKIASKMEDSREKMIDYLSVIGKRPSANSKMDFLVSEIDKQVESNIDEFLEILEDEHYETRVLVTKACQISAIKKEGYKHFLPDGSDLCNKGDVNNLVNTIKFLEAPENQDIRLAIEAKISKTDK